MAIKIAKVVERGSRVGETNRYEADFDGEVPTNDDIAVAQIALHFHPAGYGMPFEISVVGKKVTWKSWASCD